MSALEHLDTESLKTIARSLHRIQSGKRKGHLTKSSIVIAEKIAQVLMARGIYWDEALRFVETHKRA